MTGITRAGALYQIKNYNTNLLQMVNIFVFYQLLKKNVSIEDIFNYICIIQ